MCLADEVLDHLLRHLEVGDHARPERSDGADVVRGLAHHELRVVADSADSPGAVLNFHRDHGGFVGDDARTPHINDRIGRPEVDCDIARREVEE